MVVMLLLHGRLFESDVVRDVAVLVAIADVTIALVAIIFVDAIRKTVAWRYHYRFETWDVFLLCVQ